MDILDADGRIKFSGPVAAGTAWLATAANAATLTTRLTAADARAQAAYRIDSVYPLWMQANILRAGTDAEKAAMGTYIDAVRAWSNGTDPQLDALDAINPA